MSPSAGGKTKTAHTLAYLLDGSEHKVIVIAMSEFQESHRRHHCR
ncbi:MAG: hypothetical protein ACKV2U_29305 [Bryobacteraceae bacterium]